MVLSDEIYAGEQVSARVWVSGHGADAPGVEG